MTLNLDQLFDDTKNTFDSYFESLKKSNPLSVKKISDAKENNAEILLSVYAFDMMHLYAISAIDSYHKQLREKLLESGIDIGELDLEDRK